MPEASTGKVVAGSGAGFSAAVALVWYLIDASSATRVDEGVKQDECATVTRVNNSERRKVALELKKLRAEFVLMQELMLEVATHLTGHALHPKKRLSQPVSLTRAMQKVRNPDGPERF